LVHGRTGFLAGVAMEVRVKEATVGEESGYEDGHRVVFKTPRAADYRASVHDIANYLLELMTNEPLRKKMGEAARKRAVENFDYRIVARRFLQVISERLGVS
jgi:glycosyltransferase involved in cell wall biosynthesis